tara:strand:+ start:1681 stop:2076 length:396 start_codon:yes stop_codon:yes gene_type:complete
MFKFKQIKIGNWFVSITSEPFDQRCVENGQKIDGDLSEEYLADFAEVIKSRVQRHQVGAALTKTLPLDDGTDGFRFKTPRGTKGLVRITNKLDADGPTLSQGETLVRLAGDGIRCYVERVNTKRPLYNFAG